MAIRCRNGFSMIEAVFSIVILGFLAYGIYKTSNMSVNTMEAAKKSEALYLAFQTLQSIGTYAWDENSIDDRRKIVDANGDGELKRVAGDTIRKYGRKRNGNGRVFKKDVTYGTPPNRLGLETGETEPDDIDDFKGMKYQFGNQFTAEVDVFYIDDADIYDTNVRVFSPNIVEVDRITNIKAVEIVVKDEEGNEIAKAVSVFSNVGTYRKEFVYK